MRTILFIMGSLVILFCVATTPDLIRKYEVEKKGNLVEVVLLQLPSNCTSTKNSPHFKFEYQGEIHSRPVGFGVCRLQVNDKIKMKHLRKYDDTFLFQEEYMFSQFISLILIALFGIFVLIYSLFFYSTRHL